MRRTVGYQKHDTEEGLEVLNELYDHLVSTPTSSDRTACCRQVMKLVNQTRIGSKVKKRYDRARTPHQRALNSSFISKQAKQKLKQEYANLEPSEGETEDHYSAREIR